MLQTAFETLHALPYEAGSPAARPPDPIRPDTVSLGLETRNGMTCGRSAVMAGHTGRFDQLWVPPPLPHLLVLLCAFLDQTHALVHNGIVVQAEINREPQHDARQLFWPFSREPARTGSFGETYLAGRQYNALKLAARRSSGTAQLSEEC